MGVAKINNEERGTEKEERKTKNIEHRKKNEERQTGAWTKKCSGNPHEKKLIGG